MSNATGNIQTVRSDGIFHGLPVLGDDHHGLRAIVVGASGMSGQPMIDVLIQSPQRWGKVYALSRRAPQLSRSSNVAEHVPMDLLKEPEEIATELKEHGAQA